MLVLTTTESKIVPVGGTLTFDQVIVSNNKCNSRNINRLAKIGNGLHNIHLHANIAAATANTEVQLSIALDGQIQPEAVGIATTVGVGQINNISAETAAKICGCRCSCDTVSVTVVNSGDSPVAVSSGASLLISRVG